ncbi:DUF2358 domain-containing protein [Synechococcales cyanobacterium C]|uniref:DUF2358 domain-containing protein n=2 Tax=Petrachloros TaxID=2918834 RepID=A0A8K2A894_9CYAN|nr:DUF2358 domain-containing protein [Petrachloros mirabilis]NCJ07761.1 DUF2358 domain-containing protein [Petrachloros mirabilis ULC683]
MSAPHVNGLLEALKQDYQDFPKNQTYSLYAADVQFRDPLNAFQGVEPYQRMIAFIERWFMNVSMDLHDIRQEDNQILTQWTLSWQAPLPWRPHIAISGRSELTLNAQGLIQSHIDYWNCSRWQVIKQLFGSGERGHS